MTLMSSGMSLLRRGTAATLANARDMIDHHLNEDVIRVAVTGLSRAGKTVFITSLIQNLLALGDGYNSLPAVAQSLQGSNGSRLKAVPILSPGANILPWFDYQTNVTHLESANPVWPRPTDDLAEISLVLEIERKQYFGSAALGTRRVRLDILDYPGEWLLDLPMLKQTYQEWSRQTLKLLEEEPRRHCSEAFRDYVRSNVMADHRMQEDTVRRAHQFYKRALQDCRTQHGLRYLQPGRFICPGPEGSELPFLWFFPMEVADGVPTAGSVAEQLIKRFEKYKSHVSERFFARHFNKFNRQVMLVDVLGSLHAGRVAFEDTARAIGDIASGLSTQKISRLSVVATKADHVPEMSRANLRELLKVLAKDATSARRSAAVTFQTAASIYSTEDGMGKLEGHDVAVVRGLVDGKLRPWFAGQVPSIWPPDSFWSHTFFKMPDFQPRPYDRSNGRMEHLGLDEILNDVIGDLL